MKSIIVNVQIQFDSFEDISTDEEAKQVVMKQLNEYNGVLQQRFGDSSPQMFCNNIDSSDIEVADCVDEDEDIGNENTCTECGYYDDKVASHYEECSKLEK